MTDRSDSTHVQVELMARARRGEDIPEGVKLRECDLIYWAAIVHARAEWTDVDLHQAANLATCLADIERIKREIWGEGDVIVNAKGTQIVNPKHSLLETLSRRSVSLQAKLQVHALATVGRSGDQPPKAKAKKKAIAATVMAAGDELFAKPDAATEH